MKLQSISKPKPRLFFPCTFGFKAYIFKMNIMGRWGWINKKEILGIWIMAMLLEKECYGYELLQLINENPFLGSINPGGLYRVLRELEFEGMVTSNWQMIGGPARRVYRLTERGREWLKTWKPYFEQQKAFIEQILKKLNKEV